MLQQAIYDAAKKLAEVAADLFGDIKKPLHCKGFSDQ